MTTYSGISRRALIQSWAVFLAGARAVVAIERGDTAPHFVAKTIDGERVTSDSLIGKVVLIDFWATWCPPCRKDEPAVENILREFGKQGLVVLAVNMGESRRKVKKYLEESPRSAKVVLAEDTTLAAICEAKSYPLYVLIGREGTVASVQRGAVGEYALRRLLAKAGLDSDADN
jgi:thiol-disulfide isomerase/thioredoxin